MISVCAICGDESIYFEPWVKHLKRIPQVKEINVLYNKGKPKEIEGVKYKHCLNHYNFSEWRNKSLEMANEKWILVLDIDEFLSYEFIKELPSLFNEDCSFIKARRIDFWNKDKYRDDLRYSKYYLFKKDPKVFFAMPLHENLCILHEDKVEGVHPIRLVEDFVKIANAENSVYHYSFIKRKDEGSDRIALYRTIRYLNDWHYTDNNTLNRFSREDLMAHIKRESEKGMELSKFEKKHPEELKDIL